jgi:hypothetical protein
MYRNQTLSIMKNLENFMPKLDYYQNDERFLFNAYKKETCFFYKQKIAGLPYLTTNSSISLKQYKRLNQVKGYCYNRSQKKPEAPAFFVIVNSDIKSGETEVKRIKYDPSTHATKALPCFHLNLLDQEKLSINEKSLNCLATLCNEADLNEILIMDKTLYQAAILKFGMHLSIHLNTLFLQQCNSVPCYQEIENVISVLAASLAREQSLSVNITEFKQVKMAYRLALLLSVARLKQEIKLKMNAGASYKWNPFSSTNEKTIEILNQHLASLQTY